MQTEHKEQMWRTGIIAGLLLVMGAAVVYLYGTESAEEFRARIEGALMLLFPALLDSLRVTRRQKKQRIESMRPPALEPDEDKGVSPSI